jgi:hypothetical protein
MPTILYETENAIFTFNQIDVQTRLRFIISENQVQEASDLLSFINQRNEPEIKIPEEKSYFRLIILDLIPDNKGSVFCKAYRESYRADELARFPIGHGRSPLGANVLQRKGIFKNIFGKRRNPSMCGGEGYRCPQGHDLIWMITWRT